MFDYLRSIDAVGPVCSEPDQNHSDTGRKVCVIDSDDLIDRPEEIMTRFCRYIGIDYTSSMLNFSEIKGETHAAANLKHWGNAFHEEAMTSTKLLPRDIVVGHDVVVRSNTWLMEAQAHKSRTDAEYFASWVEKFGRDGADVIKRTVEENEPHYQYLKQFALKVDEHDPEPS